MTDVQLELFESDLLGAPVKKLPPLTFSTKQLSLIDEYPELIVFPWYPSGQAYNIVKALNKKHGNYFFKTLEDHIAWIDGYSIAEVVKFMDALLDDGDFRFLFTCSHQKLGHGFEKPRLYCMRFVGRIIAGYQVPRVYSITQWSTAPDDYDQRRAFCPVPNLFKCVFGDNAKKTEQFFWDLTFVRDNILHQEKEVLRFFRLHFPSAAFAVSHAQNKNSYRKSWIIILKFNGVSIDQLRPITEIPYMDHNFKFRIEQGADAFPYYFSNVQLEADQSLRLPTAKEVLATRLEAIKGRTSQLQCINEIKQEK